MGGVVRSWVCTARAWLTGSRAWEIVEWRLPGAKLRGTNRGLRMSIQSQARLNSELARNLTACRAENEKLREALELLDHEAWVLCRRLRPHLGSLTIGEQAGHHRVQLARKAAWEALGVPATARAPRPADDGSTDARAIHQKEPSVPSRSEEGL